MEEFLSIPVVFGDNPMWGNVDDSVKSEDVSQFVMMTTEASPGLPSHTSMSPVTSCPSSPPNNSPGVNNPVNVDESRQTESPEQLHSNIQPTMMADASGVPYSYTGVPLHVPSNSRAVSATAAAISAPKKIDVPNTQKKYECSSNGPGSEYVLRRLFGRFIPG
eukprot:Rmarinus@m.21495